MDGPVGAATAGRFHRGPRHFLQYFLRICITGEECLSPASLHTMLAAAAATAIGKS